MSHLDRSPASDIAKSTGDPLDSEAEKLRRQVGSENINHSSVIASRRLDEALLRLDLATGRRRQSERSISSTKLKVPQTQSQRRRPASRHSVPVNHPASTGNLAQTSDLELDESIAQTSSVWLESNNGSAVRYRLDEGAPEVVPPAAHVQPVPQAEMVPRVRPAAQFKPAAPINQPAQAKSTEVTTLQPTATPTAATGSEPSPETPSDDSPNAFAGSFADLFSTPINVMLVSEVDSQEPAESQQVVSSMSPSMPEAKAKTDTIEPKQLLDEPVSETPALETPTLETPQPAVTLDSNPTVEERVATPSNDPPTPFHATWQVDEFVVPATVDELFLAGSIAEQLAARLAAARNEGLHTIAVTSTKSGEGRSTVSMGMALSVAFSGLRVALVDADPKGVKLATDFQLDLENSWVDAIRTDLLLEETAVFSRADSLTLIPLLERDTELSIDPNELRRLLQQLKQSFDLVIVDCGASAISEVVLCDTALVVRDVHRTKALEVETLAMSLRRNGLQGIGVVENFCPQ